MSARFKKNNRVRVFREMGGYDILRDDGTRMGRLRLACTSYENDPSAWVAFTIEAGKRHYQIVIKPTKVNFREYPK